MIISLRSVCLSVQDIPLELLKPATSFSVHIYILTISRSSLSIKVIEARSRSNVFCHILPNLQLYMLYNILYKSWSTPWSRRMGYTPSRPGMGNRHTPVKTRTVKSTLSSLASLYHTLPKFEDIKFHYPYFAINYERPAQSTEYPQMVQFSP